MTNCEKYKDWLQKNIKKPVKEYVKFGVDKKTGEPDLCSNLICKNCKFSRYYLCNEDRIKWLVQEFKRTKTKDE